MLVKAVGCSVVDRDELFLYDSICASVKKMLEMVDFSIEYNDQVKYMPIVRDSLIKLSRSMNTNGGSYGSIKA